MKDIKRVRDFISEDSIRKALMQAEKRDIIELYLQLRFDKEVEKNANKN